MASKYTRLDRYISETLGVKRGDVRLMLAQGRVVVDGAVARDIQQRIGPFSHVVCDSQVLQAKCPVYIQMHKPKGVVSATKDNQYTTVIDLLHEDYGDDLHLMGRLDLNTTGLMLMTNDGHWSRRISQPASEMGKCYHVTLDGPVTDTVIKAFHEGMYFAYEGITTRPAMIELISPTQAVVTIHEGKYHQIKRMFGRFQLAVIELHRVSVGSLVLDETLNPGDYRLLTPDELERLATEI